MRFLAVLSLALCVSSAAAFGQGQAAPPPAGPPMGWNSWNHFAGHVTDADVRAAADMLVSTGMRRSIMRSRHVHNFAKPGCDDTRTRG